MADEEKEIVDSTDVEQAAEKMLSQSEVNNLIGRAKADAQAKARQQAEAEFQQRLEKLQAQKQEAEAHGDDTRDIDVDSLYQQVHERFQNEMQQKQLEQHMSEVANAYELKMSNGAKDYEDFDDVIKEFNPAEFPQIVYLVSGMDNAADIVYELSKNPQKLATVDYLAQRSPQKAQSELRRIGQSIATNKAAIAEESQAQTQAPLDRLKSSSKTGSNGQLSVGDLRSQPWLRG